MPDFKDVTKGIVAFRDERDWSQFHTPRNLAAALAIEVSELQELMLWKSDEQITALVRADSGVHRDMTRELADVLIYTLLLCHEIGVDPAHAIEIKLRENAEKYPVELAKGRSDKYSRLDRFADQ